MQNHEAVIKTVQGDQRFRLLLEKIPNIPVQAYSADGTVQYWNKASEHVYGYTEAEAVGKSLFDLIIPEEAKPFVRESVHNAVVHGIDIPAGELSLRHKDGHFVSVYSSHVVIRDSDERTQLFCIDIDMKDLKTAEAALREVNEALEQKVEVRTQELFAANQELTAMNEEMAAMNQMLQEANRQLGDEVVIRSRKEAELSMRERQNSAITNLLIQPVEQQDLLLQTILQNALQLVNAPAGYISLQDESGKNFVVRHAIGESRSLYVNTMTIEKGMQGEVCRTGEILCVPDYRLFPQRTNVGPLDRRTTVIMVPLRMEGRVKGVLAANWLDEIHPVTEEDIDVLRQFGALASIALDRSHAGKKIFRANQLSRALTQTTNAVMGQLDLAAIFHEILESASNLIGVPHGLIHTFQEEGKTTKIIAAKGKYSDRTGGVTPVSGITAQILKTGELYYVEEYHSWPERKTGPFFDDITMAVQAPLKIDGKVVGSIGLTAFAETGVLDAEQLEILDQFARMASIALNNAILHKDTVTLAFRDPLTGLPNRASLGARLEAEMNRAKLGEGAGAVLFIDLDDLKVVNDNYGHSFGDAVIITAGRHIVEIVGQEHFVARIGGDEFIVILSGEQNREKVSEMAEKLIRLLSRDYEVSGTHIHLSASLGAAFYPEDGDNAEEILKKADSAMYAAKNAGKDCWCFYESYIGDESYARLVLTNSLRRALDREELSLNFQAQVACDKRKIVGFEALLRWNSPEHGCVSPATFVPLAEQGGLIHTIGHYVLIEACRFAHRLKSMGQADLRIAVNISPRQLAVADFVDFVKNCIVEHEIEPCQLELEVTENVFIESIEDSVKKLLVLKELGVFLALDDFGTGYSSLTYLRHLPVHTLKIDKTFIDLIPGDESQERFVRFIIEMAHSLNLQVVAEGVEKQTQVDRLESFFCDIIQGYVYSRPIPADDAIRLIMSNE